MMMRPTTMKLLAVAVLVAVGVGCGSGGDEGAAAGSRGDHGGAGARPGMEGPGAGGPGAGPPQTAVPVEVTPVVRQSISAYIETNGTLEAENEVDLVARVSGPIVRLEAEEGMMVAKDRLLAEIDPSQIRSALEISRVKLDEAKVAFERAQRLAGENLISTEEFETAKANLESAEAEYDGNRIELSYTEIRAPFRGQIIDRYVKFAQTVSPGDPLFRISDFDPLLCPIQVPERNLALLSVGQRAYLEVEAWPGERFTADVLRVSPVVDAATGTVRVTLEVDGRDRLRPGMFASVYLETATHADALVIPRSALALDAIGDTVYVAANGLASRREVELGFRERDEVEVLSGLEEGEQVVTVGQDGLSDGTPIQILGPAGSAGSEDGPAEVPASPAATNG